MLCEGKSTSATVFIGLLSPGMTGALTVTHPTFETSSGPTAWLWNDIMVGKQCTMANMTSPSLEGEIYSTHIQTKITRNYCPAFALCNLFSVILILFNPLNTKRRLLYLETQFVPRSKHFSSPLQKPISLCCKWHKSLFVLR